MNSNHKRSLHQVVITQSKSLLLLLIATSMTLGCSKEDTKNTAIGPYIQSASLLTISPEQSFLIQRDYLGQINAKQQTGLGFEYGGKVAEIYSDSGDIIKKGQVLARLDIQLLNYKMDELSAQITQSKAQISLNKANLTRIQTLIANGHSSKQQLDELNAENKILTAQINGLKARIQTIKYQKEKSALIAPFNGIITKRHISSGEIISPAKPSFQIIESQNNEINVGIPSKVARRLTLGQALNIKINEEMKQAKLIAIGHQIDGSNRTVQLRLKMVEQLDQGNSYNGQLVKISIDEQIDKAGFWVPINAITDGVRGQWQLFIARPDLKQDNQYQLQSTTVKILHSNKNSVYIHGLSLNKHEIVDQGVHRYVTGQNVKNSLSTVATRQGSH